MVPFLAPKYLAYRSLLHFSCRVSPCYALQQDTRKYQADARPWLAPQKSKCFGQFRELVNAESADDSNAAMHHPAIALAVPRDIVGQNPGERLTAIRRNVGMMSVGQRFRLRTGN
jgi:hypothetical protein